jgi:hypothetical protein
MFKISKWKPNVPLIPTCQTISRHSPRDNTSLQWENSELVMYSHSKLTNHKEQNICFVTITFLNIIHRPVFHLKHDVSKTGICLRLQMKHTQLDTIDRANLCLRTPVTTPIGFIRPTQTTEKICHFHTLAE